MISSYFKTSFRVLKRQKGYTILNIVGLALGIAVFTFIYLYIQSEIRFDTQWKDYNNIYRITSEYSVDRKVEKIALTPFRLAKDLERNYKGIIASTNMFFTDPSDINDMSSITYNDEVYEIPNITLSGPGFFKVFDYEFLEGNPDSALHQKNKIVISSEVANSIFGGETAIGKKLKTVVREYTVSGVYDIGCSQTHHNFDAIVSVSSLEKASFERLQNDWYWLTCYTYIKVHDTVDIAAFEHSFNNFAVKKRQDVLDKEDLDIEGYFINKLEPVRDVHFNTSLQYDSPSNIDITYLYIFGIIAAFVLLTASINYINLATARSLKRIKEIGVRKVIGANKKHLIYQYISESLIITFIAFVIALSFVELLMPQFNSLIGKELTLVKSIFSGRGIFFGLLLLFMMFVLAVIGGSFPAFVVSSLKPADVLKGNSFIIQKNRRYNFSAGSIRRLLVSIQYIVSIGLIISTLIIYSQIDFLKSHDLGFEEEDIYVINAPDDTTFRTVMNGFLRSLDKHTSVVDVSAAINVPGYTESKMLFYVGDTSKQNIQAFNYYNVGYNYFELLKASLLKGSFFSKEMYDNNFNHYIINEAAADYLNLDSIIGTKLGISFDSNFKEGKIIGVVKNFNFSSLHRDVEPLVFLLNPTDARYILVKHKKEMKNAALAHISNVWQKTNQGKYMHYTLLEDKLDSLYRGDKNMLSLFIYFAIFVLFISSLGLYGLTSFLIQQRTREIGVRRVLGGSEFQIVTMLALVYLRIVLLAGFISSVISYFLMHRWLTTFAYHIELNGWYFVAGISITLIIAFVTVYIRSFKVIKEKPSVSLNYSG